jgi:uncharacterized protein YoxC
MQWNGFQMRHTNLFVLGSDMITQIGLTILIMAMIIGIIIIWLVARRWGPMLRRLANIVDREIEQAEHAMDQVQHATTEAITNHQRQRESVNNAMMGIRSLSRVTRELEERANELGRFAQQLANDSTIDGSRSHNIAHQVMDSAKQLTSFAIHARHTYKQVFDSLNRAAAAHEDFEENKAEAERNVREITDAMQRIRSVVRESQPELRLSRASTRSTQPQHDDIALRQLDVQSPYDESSSEWPSHDQNLISKPVAYTHNSISNESNSRVTLRSRDDPSIEVRRFTSRANPNPMPRTSEPQYSSPPPFRDRATPRKSTRPPSSTDRPNNHNPIPDHRYHTPPSSRKNKRQDATWMQ